jgi:hypothetical protein
MTQTAITGVDNIYIVANSPLETLLFDRNLVGLDFTRTCEESSVLFLEHFVEDLRALEGRIAELMVLSKGLYYWLHRAWERVLKSNLEANLVATRRVAIEGRKVDIEVSYSNFDAGYPNLVIGDTVASGATVCAALQEYRKHHRLENVFLFSYAGSIPGAQLISSFCRSIDVKITIAYGLAAFGLGDNGFDLSFLNPSTITSPKYRSLAERLYNGKPVSAVGWDFGSQAQSVEKYRSLCWLEAEHWDLQDSGVFAIGRRPTDMRLVQREEAAYRSNSSASSGTDPCPTRHHPNDRAGDHD